MNDDEIKKIWKSIPDVELDLIEKSSMINEVQGDIKNWDRMLNHSNSTKGVLIIILIGWSFIFGMIAYTKTDIQSKIGTILCLIFFWYIMIRMIGAKKLHQRNFSETYIDYLNKIRKHLKSNKRFYDVILYVFYPLAATASLLFRVDSFTTIWLMIIELLIVFGVGIIFYFLHKWALNKFILGRLDKIEKLIEELEE